MSFNVHEVFSSLRSFLSSGYVLLVVIGLLGVGIIKKLLSILVAGVAIGIIWFFAQEQIMSALGNLLSFVPL